MAGVRYTDEEDNIIRQEGMTLDRASELLGRTKIAVGFRARQIGVTLYSESTLATMTRPTVPQTQKDPTEDEYVPDGVRSRDKGEDLQAYWDAMKQVIAVQQRRHASTRRLTCDLEDNTISVAFIGDTHIGAFIDAESLERDIETIANTDGLYCIFMGDVIDNYKAGSKAATGLYHTAIPSPKDQFDVAKLVLEPLRGKCLAFLAGNHDAGWDERHAGINRIPELAEFLEAPYVSEAGASLKLNVGSERYQINVKHQWRGISTINKSNTTRRFWEEYPELDSADVVCIGHYHELDVHSTTKRGELVHLLRSGTYKLNDPYSETLGFKPTYGVPVAMFDNTEHRVRVDSALDDGVIRLGAYRSGV